ncbi:MAG: redoxin domain-containing protein [Gemmatimonadetes bacterium]|nr:redoxin domain-containing protein [Gemmatimonadota bacterium]
MNWNRSLIGIGVALPIIALLAYGMTVDPNELPSTMPGRDAPEFALRVMDSAPPDTVRLADHRGDVVVVNFWASWCLGCRDEHPDLSQTATRYEERGVKFYGVIYNDTEGNARSWIRDMGGQAYPSLVDTRSRTAIDYGLYAVPETVIIDQLGRVAHKQIGPITARQLSDIIDPLLANPPTAETTGGDDGQADADTIDAPRDAEPENGSGDGAKS